MLAGFAGQRRPFRGPVSIHELHFVKGDVPKAPPGSVLPITTGIERDPREPPIPRELVKQDTLDLPKVEAQARRIAFLRADQHMADIKMVQTGKAALTLV